MPKTEQSPSLEGRKKPTYATPVSFFRRMPTGGSTAYERPTPEADPCTYDEDLFKQDLFKR